MGLNDMSIKGFKLYPNPVKEIFNIEVNQEGSYVVIIRDHFGRRVISIESSFQIEEIDVSELAVGPYFVEVQIKNRREVLKLIKQ